MFGIALKKPVEIGNPDASFEVYIRDLIQNYFATLLKFAP